VCIEKTNRVLLLLALFSALLLAGAAKDARAGADTIAVVNTQQVIVSSEAGKKAQKALETKMKEFEAKFKKEQDELVALQKAFEKKSPAWNDEMKQEKAIEIKKKSRDLRAKQEDARMEMKALEEKHLGPIRKKFFLAVEEVARDKGFKIVLPKGSTLFVDESVDISGDVIKALNAKLK